MKMMGIRYHHLWGATGLTLSMMSPDRAAHDGLGAGSCFRSRECLGSKHGEPAAVYIDDLAVHIARCLRRQVHRCADELLRLAPALRGIAALDPRVEGGVVDQRLVHVGEDVARADRVRL